MNVANLIEKLVDGDLASVNNNVDRHGEWKFRYAD